MGDNTMYVRPVEPEPWLELANCRGVAVELFYPEQGENVRVPKVVCRACTVRAECLEYALTHGEAFGVWGGLSEKERRRLRTARLHTGRVA